MKRWSPYAAGAVVGLLQIPAFVLMNTALGASSAYVTFGAVLADMMDPAALNIDYFAKHVDGAKDWWQLALVVGVVLGAFISTRMAGTVRPAMDPHWHTLLGRKVSFMQRFVMGFCGGFLVLLGARIAGGCASGHGVSGMAQLALGSWAAVAAMFVGAVATALMLYGTGKGKGE